MNDDSRMPRRRVFVTRALSLLVAIAICAWFVVGIRQAHDTAQASAILSGAATLNTAQREHAGSLLRSAGFMNPDTEVDLLRAQLALTRGHSTQAEEILLSVVNKEPLNSQAWFSLAQHSTNSRTLLLALSHLARLVPKP
jgi:thioredoxin-like negative regulator of GroEL